MEMRESFEELKTEERSWCSSVGCETARLGGVGWEDFLARRRDSGIRRRHEEKEKGQGGHKAFSWRTGK